MTWTLFVLITWVVQPGESSVQQLYQILNIESLEHCRQIGQQIARFYRAEGLLSSMPECVRITPDFQ